MTMPKALHVAAAQLTTVPGDVPANLERHLALIDEARAQAVDVLLFPELSLVGHSAGREALRLAMPLDDPVIAKLARAAGPMAIGVGLIEEDEASLFYNSVALLRDGALLGCHRKVALATYGHLDDGMFYARGGRLTPVALAPGWNAFVGICNDLWQPSLVTDAMLRGCNLLLVPVSSALQAVGEDFDNPSGWDLNLRFNAMTWGCPVVMANRIGDEPQLSFRGGSRVLDAFGQDLVCAGDPVEQLTCAWLDPESIRRARFTLPTLRDARALAVTQGDPHA